MLIFYGWAHTSTENMPAAWLPDTFLVESSQKTVVAASAPAAFSASSIACIVQTEKCFSLRHLLRHTPMCSALPVLPDAALRLGHTAVAVLSKTDSGDTRELAIPRTCWVGLQMTGLLSFTTPSFRPVSIRDSKQMMPCAQQPHSPLMPGTMQRSQHV